MGMQDASYYFENHFALEERLVALVDLVRHQLAGAVPDTPAIYIGYSQGATMGALLMPSHAAAFPLVLLVEGGYEQWPMFSARRFVNHGGRKVYFACGTQSCNAGAQRSVRWLTQAGAEARLGYARGAGHTPTGAVGEHAREGLLWLMDSVDPMSAEGDHP